MHFPTLALAALAAVASAEDLRFTHLSPPLPGLSRRDEMPVYSPETLECGDGATCAEACGADFEECKSGSGLSSCFNPKAGETCCSDLELQGTCRPGFFCASHNAESLVCCAEGASLEECAKLNDTDALETGGSKLKADSEGESDDAESTGSEDEDEDEGEGDAPTDAPDEPASAAAGAVPGVALVAGFFALLL